MRGDWERIAEFARRSFGCLCSMGELILGASFLDLTPFARDSRPDEVANARISIRARSQHTPNKGRIYGCNFSFILTAILSCNAGRTIYDPCL